MSENEQNQNADNVTAEKNQTGKPKAPLTFEEKVIKFLIAITVISALTLIASLINLFSDSAFSAAGADGAAAPKMAKAPRGVLIPSQAYKKFDSYDKTIAKKDKMTAVVFYADWCGFCRKSIPIFLDLTKDKDLKKMYNFTFVNGDTPDGGILMRHYGANAYPSFYLVNPNTESKEQVSNEILFGLDGEKNVNDEMKKFFDEQNG